MNTRKNSAWLALLIGSLIVLPTAAFAEDTELFSSSAKANVLLLLDVTGSMADNTAPVVPPLYDTDSGNSGIGNRKMDALWKVVYTLLNANGSSPTAGSNLGKLGTATKTGGGTSSSLVAGTSYNKITITGVSQNSYDNLAIFPNNDNVTGTFISVISGASSAGIKYTSKSKSGTTVTLNIPGGQVFSNSVTFPAGSLFISSSSYNYPRSYLDAISNAFRNNLTSLDGASITDETDLKANIGLMTFDTTGSPGNNRIPIRAQITPTFSPTYLSIWDNVWNYAKPGGYTPAAAALGATKGFFQTATNNNANVCNKSFVIMITDGADTVGGVTITSGTFAGKTGTSDSSMHVGSNNLPDTNAMYRLDAVIQEAAKIKNTPDLTTYDSTAPPVVLYTIGLGISGNDPESNILREVLRRASQQNNAQMSPSDFQAAVTNTDAASAQRGSGNRYYFATDIATLSDAVTNAVQEATSALYSFTAPTVASVRMTDRNYLYKASFCPRPPGVPFWEGSLQAFTLDSNGVMSTSPVWDDNTVLASQTLAANRKIYTADNTASASPYNNTGGNWILRDFGNTSSSASGGPFVTSMLGVSPTALIDNVVKYARGYRLYNAGWLDNNNTKLGDIFHSKPVVVGPPSRFYFDTGYSTPLGSTSAFVDNMFNRNRVVYVGTNDGMLHAFLSGTYTAGQYDNGTGAELFGYIPNLLLSNMVRFLPGLASSDHDYYVDSSPRVADVWIDGYTDANKYANLSSADGVKQSSEWRTVLISGLRMGGDGYFALDVTNPGTTSTNTDYSKYPIPLWEYTDDSNLGNSWSEPVIGKVKVQSSSTATPVDRWVAIFGGGMSADKTIGNSLTVLDIATGKPLRIFDNTTVANVSVGIDNVVPASPTAILDSRGYIRYVYVADLNGTVYKFDFVNPGVGTIGSGTPFTGWKSTRIFQASAGQPVFHRIEVSPFDDYRRYLFFGTGNQEYPISDNGAGKFYGIIDYDGVVRTTPVTEAYLSDVTANLWGTGTPVVPTDNGWFVNLATVGGPTGSRHVGEKVLSDPVVFYNNVYFTTYTYNPNSVACSNSGIARVYGLSTYNASAGFNALPSLSAESAYTKVPYHEYTGVAAGTSGGVASSPSLSVNPAGQSTLFVGFSTGTIEQITINSPSSMKSIKSWKEIF